MSSEDTPRGLSGRSFEPLQPGQEVLVVTCPVMIDSLLRSHLGERFPAILHAYRDILAGAGRNGSQGVVRGTITEAQDANGMGVHPVEATLGETVFETGDAVVAAGKPLDDLIAEHPWLQKSGQSFEAMMLGALSGLSEDDEPPPACLRYTELSEEERQFVSMGPKQRLVTDLLLASEDDIDALGPEHAALVRLARDGGEGDEAAHEELLRRASATAARYERFYIAFPANETAEFFLKDVFRRVISRIEASTAAEVQKKSGYL